MSLFIFIFLKQEQKNYIVTKRLETLNMETQNTMVRDLEVRREGIP